MSGDFKLSASLRGHEDDVRGVAFPNASTIYSASRDTTVKQWELTAPKPPVFDDTITLQGSNWFNSLAYSPPSKLHPEGLVAAGGRETFVFVKKAGSAPEEDPYRMLIGHAGNVSCLAFNHDGSKIISGGWDSQVFVWDVEGGNVTAALEGHQGNVWGVFVYDEQLVLTACADKMIRLFDMNGKMLRTIKGHTDVVRCFCKLPEGHWSGAAFASAGNDQVIRFWSLEGAPMGEMDGHTEYIYGLAILPNGDIVSSSEDRTVKIWRHGACIQTITHPAISMWTVAACQETGDIVSGGSDKILRVFSRDPERQGDAETLRSFDEANRQYAIPAETASQDQPFQKENLPGPEALQTQTGQRDGQQLFIRENDGSVTAHLWSSSKSQWDLIGTVVSGEGSGTQKKMYNGQEYDYVFDIDIEDGKPPLKLPYNLSQDNWTVAQKFLADNELPMTYYEQVANWIADNTKGARLGRSEPAPQARDPWGSDKRYRPGDAASSSTAGTKKLPQRSFIQIIEGNPANAISILLEKGKAGDLPLDSADLSALENLTPQMSNKQDPHPTSNQVSALMKVITKAQGKQRVPAVGVLALCAVSPSFVSITSAGEQTIVDQLAAANLFQQRQESANNVVHGLRTLANLFASEEGRLIADGCFDSVLELVRPFATEPESPAQFKALATLYLNYAVLLTSGAPASESKSREARAEALLIDTARMLECESPAASDADAMFRTLCAFGTLFTLGQDFRMKLKGAASGSLHFAAKNPGAQGYETQQLLQEIKDELR